MGDQVHAERREPEQPAGAFDLAAAGRELLAQAQELSAGRAARTLTPGAGSPLSQTLLAVTTGARLDEHRAPGPATIQVLHGTVTLHAGGADLTLREGQWAVIPPEPHDVLGQSDAVVLLTVVVPSRSG